MNQFGRPTLKMLALISIISLLISSTLIGCQRQQPVTIEDVPPDQIVALGVTHFSGMAIEGTETDELIVDQTSTGDIVEFRDNSTSVWRLADGGAITYAGNQTMTGNLVVNGTTELNGTVTLENDETLVNSTNGTIGVTVQSTGTLNVLTGNLAVGNGTPSTTQNGEDAYIEGMLDVDGNAGFEGNVYLNAGVVTGTLTVGGATELNSTVTLQNDETIVNSTDGTIGVTVQSTGTLNVLTGNLAVGNGTPSTTQDGEDAYVEGTFEVDGGAAFAGNLYANAAIVTTTLTLASATVWITDAGIIAPSATFVKLLSGDTVTMTNTTTPISAGTTTGQLLILENTNGAYVINIDGTGGNVKCTANIALTALDVVTMIWDGTEWVCLALYVNA